MPFLAVRTPRSRPSAPYLGAAWVPGTAAGLLTLGYEGALRGPLRLYAELGALGSLGNEVVAVPYGRIGVRLRF